MVKKIRVLLIFGTRPEAIKMAPVVKELNKNKRVFKTIVCVTAQHRHMLDQMLELFNIRPDIDLNLMRENQSLENISASALVSISKVLKKINPHLVLVQGDTTTAMTAALASFYQKIPVGHIEAGLRTNNIYYPFPEEINRTIISRLSTFNFAPTKRAFDTLLKEGIQKKRISLTGNTVIDALRLIIKKKKTIKFKLGDKNKVILVTAHRRENFGRPLLNICEALMELVNRNPDIEIVYPVHPNPNVKKTVYTNLKNIQRIHLIKPLEYDELVFLLQRAYLILTDSGGLQEEAPTFSKPVLVLRNETERPEGIKAGVARIVGTDCNRIISDVEKLLSNRKQYNKMAKAISPYGDGYAARRIVSFLIKEMRVKRQ